MKGWKYDAHIKVRPMQWGSGGGGLDYEEVMLVLPLARPSALQIPLSLLLILLHTTLFSEDLKRVKLK